MVKDKIYSITTFYPYMGKDMNCEVAFVVADNTEIYLKNMSSQEFEMGLMCVLNNNILEKDLPIFVSGYCYDLNYVKKFWEYFNVLRKYDATRYVGLFITALRVRGYDVDTFCEQNLVTRGKNGHKRKR